MYSPLDARCRGWDGMISLGSCGLDCFVDEVGYRYQFTRWLVYMRICGYAYMHVRGGISPRERISYGNIDSEVLTRGYVWHGHGREATGSLNYKEHLAGSRKTQLCDKSFGLHMAEPICMCSTSRTLRKQGRHSGEKAAYRWVDIYESIMQVLGKGKENCLWSIKKQTSKRRYHDIFLREIEAFQSRFFLSSAYLKRINPTEH